MLLLADALAAMASSGTCAVSSASLKRPWRMSASQMCGFVGVSPDVAGGAEAVAKAEAAGEGPSTACEGMRGAMGAAPPKKRRYARAMAGDGCLLVEDLEAEEDLGGAPTNPFPAGTVRHAAFAALAADEPQDNGWLSPPSTVADILQRIHTIGPELADGTRVWPALFARTARTPAATLSAALLSDRSARFRKVSPGTFQAVLFLPKLSSLPPSAVEAACAAAAAHASASTSATEPAAPSLPPPPPCSLASPPLASPSPLPSPSPAPSPTEPSTPPKKRYRTSDGPSRRSRTAAAPGSLASAA